MRSACLAIALVAACGHRDDRLPADPPAARAAPADARPIDAAPRAALPGPAYLLADGVFRLDGSGPAEVLERRDMVLDHATLDVDGRVWVAEHDGPIVEYDGGVPQKVDLHDTVTLAPASDGGVWAITDVVAGAKLVRIDTSSRSRTSRRRRRRRLHDGHGVRAEAARRGARDRLPPGAPARRHARSRHPRRRSRRGRAVTSGLS